MYQLVNVITCEITDQASYNSVCAFFMDFYETVHIYCLMGSNMCQTNYFKKAYYALGGSLVYIIAGLRPAERNLIDFQQSYDPHYAPEYTPLARHTLVSARGLTSGCS